MGLPKSIKIDIADCIVRIVAPVMIISMLLLGLGLFALGGQQYHRLVPVLIVLLLMVPPWMLALKGKPLIGLVAMLVCLSVGILAGMTVSGGIRAPAFVATLSIVTIFIVLFDIRGGVIFSVLSLAFGALFIWLDAANLIPKVDESPAIYYLFTIGIFLFMQLCFVLIPVRLMMKALLESKIQKEELKIAIGDRQRSQQELQSILNRTPDIIYRLDPTGKITFISDAVKEYGYTPEELLGKPIIDYIHRDDQPGALKKLNVRRSGNRGSKNLEVRFLIKEDIMEKSEKKNKDKRWTIFHVSSEGIHTETGPGKNTYIGTQGIARDISKTKYYENQITQLAAVVEQAAEDVVITDSEGFIQYVNPKLEALTGYSKEDVIGKTPNIFKSGKHDEAFYADLWATIKKGNTWNGKIWNKIKDGSLILQDVTITPILDGSDKVTGYASVRRDITGQVGFEERLRQSQKMEAIGTLAGGIAHDFNNILSGILGYTQLAQSNIDNSEKAVGYMSNVIKASQRATELVQQILTFSRQTEYITQPLNIYSVVNEALKLLRSSIPSTIEINKQLNSKALVMADPTKIHQVVMNLCTNAYHAMRKTGGILTISLKDMVLSESKDFKHNKMPKGKYLVLEISDTGHGMDEKTLEKAFDPYYTTKKVGQGTGLGLPIVQAIVEEHDGFLELHSSPGKGTSFYLNFPIVENQIETSKNEPEKTSLLNGNETIMFVDDEEQIRDIGKESLKKYGYNVSVFKNGLDALKAFQKDPSKYNLIVTDMTMPGMTGDKLAIELLKMNTNIPVFLCTGYSENIPKEQVKSIGIECLLIKPVPMADLAKKIREALDKENKIV